MINPKEQELLNLKDELQELLEDGEDNQLLRDKIQELENQLQQKENIIKEVRDEMERAKDISVNDEYHIMEHEKKLLEILDKVD